MVVYRQQVSAGPFPTATAIQSFAMVSSAQLPMQPRDPCRQAVIAGQGQGSWEGKCQREKCRMSECVQGTE